MRLFYQIVFLFMFLAGNVFAYDHPRGLYVLEYPVPMPDISLVSETGRTESILSSSADLTIMIFWSQNCAPCLREMKSLEKFYPVAAKDNIRIMLVAPAAEWRSLAQERKFLTKYSAPTLPFYNDTDNRLSLKLGIGSTPYTVIMNKDGKKIATIQGEANWESKKLYKMIKKLLP